MSSWKIRFEGGAISDAANESHWSTRAYSCGELPRRVELGARVETRRKNICISVNCKDRMDIFDNRNFDQRLLTSRHKD